MKMTGDDFIDLLYRCEDDERVVQMREALGIERPVLGKKFKEDGYVAVVNKPHRLEVFFSDIAKFDESIDENQDCGIILSRVNFYYRTDISLPFGLKMDDSLEEVTRKLGKAPDYSNKNFPIKIWVLRREDGKKYLLYADFDEDDYQELISVDLSTYENNIKYLPDPEKCTQ